MLRKFRQFVRKHWEVSIQGPQISEISLWPQERQTRRGTEITRIIVVL